MKKKKTQTKYGSVGGQALMEGIMMNGPEGKAMALRLPDGSISVEKKTFTSIKDKNKFFGIPMVRGIVNFVEALIFGYKCLMESAEKTGMDVEEEENMSKLDRWISDHFGEKMMKVIGAISMVLGFALAFALFVWMPSFLFDAINKLTGERITMLRTIFEGLLRIIIFVIYMFAVSKMKEIKRVYMYHGAEHKSIFCYESGEEMTVENVRKQSRFHPRCGTSFIFVMIILSILVSSVVALAFPSLTQIRPVWICVKLLIMPIVMGLGYEFIRYAGKHDNLFVKILSAPGLWMQRITTAEPDDSMIEVGIAAINAVIPHNDEEKENIDKVEETENISEEPDEEEG
ncbi:MAG TPA: DUF1385 domain-containing protein [Ruminococcaceae bacterium]|nr:DUF1385 domain-containing protein [Oscillospiraceae bacterium]